MIDEKTRVTNEPFIASPPLVIERDDGLFQLGLDDESSLAPFATRNFAEQVRLHGTRHQSKWLVQ
jgi:hypothetical protein